MSLSVKQGFAVDFRYSFYITTVVKRSLACKTGYPWTVEAKQTQS